MEQVTEYLENVTDQLINDSVQLWELPPAVACLYYLGEASARRVLIPQLIQAEADRDRYYRAASRGGFQAPIKRQGLTYADLCRERGQHALADKVEAEMSSIAFNVRGN
jgi:hypothetical protein